MNRRMITWAQIVLAALPLTLHGAETTKPVTFNEVLPVLQRNCQNCHRPGQMGPMSLLDYGQVRPWAKAIKQKVMAREMPPWNADPQFNKFGNDPSLTQSDIDLIAAWVDQGAQDGPAQSRPKAATWPDAGWQITPDVVIRAPEYAVPASTPNSVIEWADVVVPTGFTKDTWVTSIEVRPTEPAVAHHICVTFQPHRDDVKYYEFKWLNKKRDDTGTEIPRSAAEIPTSGTQLATGGGQEACFLPGMQPLDLRPMKTARLVPAGWDLVFNIHYTPNGKAVVDRPAVGLTIAREEQSRRYVALTVRAPQDKESFAIPPHDGNWAAPAGEATFYEDAELITMSPHMHYRGKSFRYTLIRPDGSKEIILNVPKYDFNWQFIYMPEKPVKIPKGSKLVVQGHFDNSVNNKYNPDPSKPVYYGGMVWEEMCSGFIGVVVDRNVDDKKIITVQPGVDGA